MMTPTQESRRWLLWVTALLMVFAGAVVLTGGHPVHDDAMELSPSWLRAIPSTENQNGDNTSSFMGGAMARILQIRWYPTTWEKTIDMSNSDAQEEELPLEEEPTDTGTDASPQLETTPVDNQTVSGTPEEGPTDSEPEPQAETATVEEPEISFAEAVKVDPHPVPRNPPDGYFNYDMDDGDYGPRRWHRVNTDQAAPWYELSNDGFGTWKGHLGDKEPTKNRCESRRLQSPIDLFEQKGDGVRCDALHKIKTRGGYFQLSGDRITKNILPNKLQLVFDRRPCLDWNDLDCREPRPPMADYPRYSSDTTHFSDMLQWDLKVPAEHRMEGDEFDAEIQALHVHIDRSRVTQMALLIRARDDGFNEDFQIVLDQFQKKYDENQQQCRRRQMDVTLDSEFPVHNATAHSEFDADRQLQTDKSWDPYGPSFQRTIYFFRYDGCYPEPPCYPLTWFVMSKPMIISTTQLNQIKYLLFTNVDPEKCTPTSVHTAEQSVARPLQDVESSLEIQKCTEDNFDSSD